MQGISIRDCISFKGDGIIDFLPPNLFILPRQMIAKRREPSFQGSNFKIEIVRRQLQPRSNQDLKVWILYSIFNSHLVYVGSYGLEAPFFLGVIWPNLVIHFGKSSQRYQDRKGFLS